MHEKHCGACPIQAEGFQQTMLEFVSATQLSLGELSAGVKSIIGNGQPGRLGKVEESVSELSGSMSALKGALILLATILGPAVAVALYMAGSK